MNGRRTITLLLAVTGQPLALAQAPDRARRIAWLASGRPGANEHLFDSFARAMEDIGWVVGKNLTIDRRYASGDPAQAQLMTKEMLALKPDVFVSSLDTS
jgi:putative tryptophan/tyrosine transport system substrate-binding protein